VRLNPLFRCISGTLGLFLAASGLARADGTAPATPAMSAQQTAYQSSIAQEGIRKQTDQVQTEISQLITELNVNGLNDPTNLNLLSNASVHLSSLSQEDMQKVINTLQSASMNLQDQDRQKSLLNASVGQKDILLKLKSLAAALSAEESQKEIPTMLQNLIVRQSANIRRTSTIPASQTVSQLDATQKVTHGMVSAEQSSIADQIDLVYKILSAKPEATGTAAAGDTSKAVLDAMTNSLLQSTAQLATQLTTAGPFPSAIDKQKAVRTYLIGFLRIAMSSIDPATQLQQAKAQLDQVVNDQKDLADSAKQSKQDGATLAQRQQKISDDLSVTQAALQSISPAATSPLDQAQQAMTQSSDALSKAKDPSTTAPQQQAVADALQKAEDTLDQQIAAAEKQENESPVDKLAQLQQLQNAINQAQQNPQTSSSDLQKLQQDAMVPAPQAADKIADAADQLQQQQSDQPPPSQSPSGQPPPANQPSSSPSPADQANQPQPGQAPGNQPPPDHTEANKLLAEASADVQAQEDAAQDYQALSQASQQLNQAQQETQAADQSMQNPANHDLTAAAQDLSQAQANVDQTSKSPPPGGLPSDSQQALAQASDALKNASIQAVQAKGADAAAQGEKAEAALKQAQDGLGKAMAQVQAKAQASMPGQMNMNQFAQNQLGQMTGQLSSPEGMQRAYSGMLTGYGPRAAAGSAQVVGGLKPKDRAALTQYQKEKSPPEYADQVQQYLKNLADASETH
jgi:hypothetical protein